jgi:hypothetical protein
LGPKRATRTPAAPTKAQSFTKEERAAMQARARELKAEARAGKDRAEDNGPCSRTAFALRELTHADEQRVAALVKRAVS